MTQPCQKTNRGLYMTDGRRKIDFILIYDRHESHTRIAEPDPTPNGGGPEMIAMVETVNHTAAAEVVNHNQSMKNLHELRREFFQENLIKEGLELELENVDDLERPITVVKVHAPFSTLCQYAEELHIKVPLKIYDRLTPLNELQHSDSQPRNGHSATSHRTNDDNSGNIEQPSWWSRFWRKLNKIGDADDTLGLSNRTLANTSIKKVEHIKWPFKRKNIKRYLIDPSQPGNFIKDRYRIEIVYEILQQTPNNPEDARHRGIAALLEHKIYEIAYPLHDSDILHMDASKKPKVSATSSQSEEQCDEDHCIRQKLKSSWATWGATARRQPLNKVTDYFGEKIGFYFAFMDCYTKMLIFPSAIGLLVLLYGLIYASTLQEIDNICTPLHQSSASSGHSVNVAQPSSNTHHRRKRSSVATTVNNNSVADLWMCPICQPPGCEPWEMFIEGCAQYQWAFRLDNEASILLGSCVILWSIIFLKVWRRRESELAVEWDTFDIEEQNSLIRPLYEEKAAMTRKNPVTSEVEPFIPPGKRFCWISMSVLATVFMLIFATACLIALVISRIYLYTAIKNIGGQVAQMNVELSRWGVHGLIFVMVSIFESVYHSLAHRLTEYECPRTEKEFMSSLLWKIFIFEMLNDFVPIAYAAFIKGKVNTPLALNFMTELCDGGCIGEVTELVAVLLLARLVVGNTMEVGVPWLKTVFKDYLQRKDARNGEDEGAAVLPRWRKDYILEDVELDGVYDEYMEMMIQFSFIVFFSPALPAAPFLCFLNNIAEIRVDAINMLLSHRRPLPMRVPGIQIWNRFMDIIIKFGVLCNAALLAFTSDNIPRLYYKYTISASGDYSGFTKFSLSYINSTAWPEKTREHFESRNIEQCWYPDWRSAESPYNYTSDFWKIFVLRLVAFSLFSVIFFVLMWFINTFISDMPSTATTTMKRRAHLVTKAVEAEMEKAHLNVSVQNRNMDRQIEPHHSQPSSAGFLTANYSVIPNEV